MRDGEVHPRTGHVGPEGEKRCSSTLSLTSALDGDVLSTPRPGRFVPRKDPASMIRSPDRPARNESLYRLRYPSPRQRWVLWNRPTLYFMRGKDWQPHYLLVPIVWKSGSPNLLEPSGPFQARPLHDCQSVSFLYRSKGLIFRRINSKPLSPCMIRDRIDTDYNKVVRICGVKKRCNIKGNSFRKGKQQKGRDKHSMPLRYLCFVPMNKYAS